MQVSVVLNSGECIHATLATKNGLSLYGDAHLHLPVGAVIHLADIHAEDLSGIAAHQRVVSATQILSTRIYLLRPA